MKTPLYIIAPICILGIVGGAVLYRGHQISAGLAAYRNKDYPRALEKLAPFSGWKSREAEAALGTMYLDGLGTAEDDLRAIAFLSNSAAAGDVSAQCILGSAYRKGRGVPLDFKRADFWLEKAAVRDNAAAQGELAILFIKGEGVEQNYGKAVNWLEKAASKGDPGAQNTLGILYYTGTGVPKNFSKAAELFQAAAGTGLPAAEFNLGLLYYAGNGPQQDYAAAYSWYRKAAEQGYPEAFNNLGQQYVHGQGVDRDIVFAYALFNIAAGLGTEFAQDNRDKMAAHMTTEQIISGQKISSTWKVGMSLKRTATPEDLAPQFLFNELAADADVATIKRSYVWLSKSFQYHGDEMHSVFIATSGGDGDDCHACGAYLSVVNFGFDRNLIGFPQRDFMRIGGFGKAPDMNDINPPDAPKANTKNDAYDLSDETKLILADDYDTGQGETMLGKTIISYDEQKFAWTDFGFIQTGDDNSGADCKEDCYEWSGTVGIKEVPGVKWPDIIVTAHGTELRRNSMVVPIPKLITYRFDGKKYERIEDSITDSPR